MAPNNRTRINRMISSKAQIKDLAMQRNATQVKISNNGDASEETKAVTNSHIFGDLSKSHSNSHLLSQSRLQN